MILRNFCLFIHIFLLTWLRATTQNPLFEAPTNPSQHAQWLAELESWKATIKNKINYSGSIYDDIAVNWTRLSYIQPQTHLYDRYLYDPVQHSYTVDRYLADVEERYGGIDSILLWPTYTNLGIDARNQFDYFRVLPGGLAGLKDLIAQFHQRGIHVLLAYNPWDQNTRANGGMPHEVSLAELLKEVDGDGFNGDTMVTMYRSFWDAGKNVGHEIVGEMEGGGYAQAALNRPADQSWESAKWSPMGWGYFRIGLEPDNITYAYETGMGVDKLKWLDSRRMTHVCDRWAKDRTTPLQFAFFNGIGFESWENVWGMFVQITPRDGEAIKRVSTLLRWLGAQQFIQDYASWIPYTPDLKRDGHFAYSQGGLMASKFVHRSADCVWLVVNRDAVDAEAEIDTSSCSAESLFDLYAGKSIQQDASGMVKVPIEAGGYAAVLATSRSQSLPLPALLQKMSLLTARSLKSYSAAWSPLQQTMVGSESSGKFEETPPGMVLVPRTVYHFRTAGVEVEGGCDLSSDTWGVCCDPSRTQQCPGDASCNEACGIAGEDSRGLDVQFPWESLPARFHDTTIDIGPFYIGARLVSNEDFALYLAATKYQPLDKYNFLVGWTQTSTGTFVPPVGKEKQPVVWISWERHAHIALGRDSDYRIPTSGNLLLKAQMVVCILGVVHLTALDFLHLPAIALTFHRFQMLVLFHRKVTPFME